MGQRFALKRLCPSPAEKRAKIGHGQCANHARFPAGLGQRRLPKAAHVVGAKAYPS
jgi:hypothetical protein